MGKKVSMLALSEAFCNKSGFVPFNSAIGVIFNLVYPFAINMAMTRMKMNHRLSVVSLKSPNFDLNTYNPLWVLTRMLICL